MPGLADNLRRLCARALPMTVRERLRARMLARSSKRLDLAAAQMAMLLHHLDHNPFSGKTAAELGAGWVLSHSCCAWLLGADRIDAYDISSLIDQRAWRMAILSADPSIVRDVLAPFSSHHQVRSRLAELTKIAAASTHDLGELGIHWHGGHDIIANPLPRTAEVIWSLSVMEHLPEDRIHDAIDHLATSLGPDGVMIHVIHLEDHQDLRCHPFAFLETHGWSPDQAIRRGNRLRPSQWEQLLSAHGLSSPTRLFTWHRPGSLPQRLAPPFSALAEEDLDVSHLGVMSRASP